MSARHFLIPRWSGALLLRRRRKVSHMDCCCSIKTSAPTAQCYSLVPFTPMSTPLLHRPGLPIRYPSQLLGASLRLPCFSSRHMSSISSGSDTEDETLETLGDRELKEHMENFRHTLYPHHSDDPLIKQLNSLNSVQELFSFLHKNRDNLNPILISQAVLVLWDFQRIFWHVTSENCPEDSFYELQHYTKAVIGHPDFENLLRLVGHHYREFDPNALTCSLVYFRKMGVSRYHPTIQSLISRCEKELATYPLSALSRFMVATNHGYLWSIYVTKDALPIILKHLKNCEDAEQLRLITICLAKHDQLLTDEVMQTFTSRVRALMKCGGLTSKHHRAVVRIISFLDSPLRSVRNADLIRDLMLCLSGEVENMRLSDIAKLHRTLQSILEPAEILEEIQTYVLKLIEHRDPATLPTPILACVVPFSSPNLRNQLFEDLLTAHIKSPSFPLSMPIIYKILRYLKTIGKELCDLFWDSTLQFLKVSQREDMALLRICHKYMHFNNNLGGSYRHLEFEQQMMDWLLEAVKGVAGVVPMKFCRITAFFLAYGQGIVPLHLMDKLEEMTPQFTILDCLNLSRGLVIATELNSKFRSPNFYQQLASITSILSSGMREKLASGKLPLTDLNLVMRIYINMRGVTGTDLFEGMIAQYCLPQDLMSSRLLRDVCFNLLPQRCLAPPIMELMANYVENHSQEMLGDTVDKFLYLCYWLGYVPKSDKLASVSANLILRDKDKMTGLSLLQACMALCYLQHFPVPLAHSIFNVEFLEQIDAEIKLCYSKASYPMKVRHILMELNRAVCLEYPQADVPWFHTKFCEELSSHDSVPTSSFYTEVFSILSKAIGSDNLIKKISYSPYFYKIDFEIILDERDEPIPLYQQNDLEGRGITRVAILLLREEAFSSGTVQLRGPSLLRRRHLELMNFRIVEIPQSLWQAMYMSEEQQRINFILRSVWPHKYQDEPTAGDSG